MDQLQGRPQLYDVILVDTLLQLLCLVAFHEAAEVLPGVEDGDADVVQVVGLGLGEAAVLQAVHVLGLLLQVAKAG